MYMDIYIYVNVFHALNVIMFFRGSKCEAFAGHGVILYQFGCSTLLFSDYIGKTNFKLSIEGLGDDRIWKTTPLYLQELQICIMIYIYIHMYILYVCVCVCK